MSSIEKPNHVYLAEQIIEELPIKTLQDTNEIFYWNKETGIYEPADTKLKKLIQTKVEYNTTTRYVNEVMDAIRRFTFIEREAIASNINDVPLQNGVFDFENETMRDYTEQDFFLKKHGLKLFSEPPTEKINAGKIEEFISQVTGTQEDEILLKEIIGYCFYRKMPFQNLFLLVGSGGNGKSVYLNILRKMLGGENVSNESLQNLAMNRFASSNLYLKNANVFGDLSSKSLSDAGQLKLLTGDDVITAEQKFKPPFQFRSYAKIIASCNEVPESPDQSDGWFRRPIIINFPNSFEGKEDRQLFEKLSDPEELSDFFYVCIRAFKDALNDNYLVKKQSISEKKQSYLAYSNSAFAFCQHKLEYDPESELTTEEIYRGYQVYCKNNVLVLKDERQFFQKLYKFYNHKVYKRRKSSMLVGKEIREYYIMGACWK